MQRATRDVERVREALRQLGADPGPAIDDGPTALERRALRLAAGGATNSEAAEQLGLSPQTVAALLRHAFAGLGIESRSGLVGLNGALIGLPHDAPRRG